MPIYRTVRQGQAAAVWRRNGTCTIVEGPRRVNVFRKRFQLLSLYSANQNEYLAVHHVGTGRVEHRQGPCAMFLDPLRYEKITKHKAESLTSHEVMVVYRPSPRYEGNGAAASAADEASSIKAQAPQGYTAKVSRTIITGPVVHVPEPDEFPHVFRWHGVDPESKTRHIPGANVFSKLSIVPDQLYYNVRDVRTRDDALITAKVMIFYELRDLTKMLDTTPDPIGDFINAVCGDVVAFCAVRTYEEFVEQTDSLSDMRSFPQLTARAERSGYAISKVVFRGYHCSERLAKMHSDAMEQRTLLRLRADTQQQEQDLEDFKLKREMERFEKRRNMEQMEDRHRSEMAAERAANELRNQEEKEQLKLRLQQQSQAQRLGFFKTLNELGVDLTRYLVAQYQHPDRILRVENTGSKDAPKVQPLLHLMAGGRGDAVPGAEVQATEANVVDGDDAAWA